MRQLDVSGRVLLGLVGAPGAGKTTVAEQLVAALGESAVHVPMDGFHLGDAVWYVRFGKSPDAARDWVVESVDERNALRILEGRDRADLVLDVTHSQLPG